MQQNHRTGRSIGHFWLRIGVRSGLAAGFLGSSIIASVPMTAPAPTPIQASAARVIEIGELVGPTQAIAITFSSRMDSSSVNAATRIQPAAAVQITWRPGGSTMHLSPDTRWRMGERYSVTIAGEARAADGQQIGTPLRVTFVIATEVGMDDWSEFSPPIEPPSSTATPLPTPVAPPPAPAVHDPPSDPGRSATHSPVATPSPSAEPVPVAPPPGVAGYGAGTTGGAGGRVYTVSSWAEFKAAVQASGPRIVQVVGDRDIDGAGERVTVRNGNLTIDGSAWSGELTRYSLVLRASNIVVTQMRLRPGDQIADVGEGDGLAINPPPGSSLSHIVIDHCSLLWASDVTLAILNRSSDITVQYSILGASLYHSANPSSPNGYGPNVTTTGAYDPSYFGQRITFYRNYLPHNYARNLRAHGTDGVEWVNNVIYDWGVQAGHGNPRGANAVGNMFKRGPQTGDSNRLWNSELNQSYTSLFSNSVYWADNIGLGFNPTTDFFSDVRRSAPYGGGLHNVQAAPASAALAEQVVAGAGPTLQDAADGRLKSDFGSGSGSFYNGTN